MPKEDRAALIFLVTLVLVGVPLIWIGVRRHWGLLKSIFFIGLPITGVLLLYLFLMGAKLQQVLLYLGLFFLVSIAYSILALLIGTAIGKALKKLFGLDK